MKKICLVGHADDRAKADRLLSGKKVDISHISCTSDLHQCDALARFLKKDFYADLIVTREDLVEQFVAIHPGLCRNTVTFQDLPEHLRSL